MKGEGEMEPEGGGGGWNLDDDKEVKGGGFRGRITGSRGRGDL